MIGDAVEVGEAEVQHDDVGSGGIPGPQRRRRVRRLLDDVAMPGEVGGDRGPSDVVVLDEQEVGAAHPGQLCRRRGEPDPDAEAAERARLGLDRPAHGLHEPACDREAHAQAVAAPAPGPPGPVEAVEQVRQRVGRDARACVVDRDAGPRRRPAMAAVTLIAAPGGACSAALSITLPSATSNSTASTRTGGRSSGMVTRSGRPVGVGRVARSVVSTSSARSYGRRSGRSAPAWIRPMSSRPFTRPPRRRALGIDRRRGSADGAGGVRLHGGVGEAARERPDARDRRPEVVRHGIEDRGPQRVTLAGDLGRRELRRAARRGGARYPAGRPRAPAAAVRRGPAAGRPPAAWRGSSPPASPSSTRDRNRRSAAGRPRAPTCTRRRGGGASPSPSSVRRPHQRPGRVRVIGDVRSRPAAMRPSVCVTHTASISASTSSRRAISAAASSKPASWQRRGSSPRVRRPRARAGRPPRRGPGAGP